MCVTTATAIGLRPKALALASLGLGYALRLWLTCHVIPTLRVCKPMCNSLWLYAQMGCAHVHLAFGLRVYHLEITPNPVISNSINKVYSLFYTNFFIAWRSLCTTNNEFEATYGLCHVWSHYVCHLTLAKAHCRVHKVHLGLKWDPTTIKMRSNTVLNQMNKPTDFGKDKPKLI